MEINYVYTKTRANFGRHNKFIDTGSKVLLDIEPNHDLAASFIDKDPVDRSIQWAAQQSEHEANTELRQKESKGVNHVEGGWPRDVNPQDLEQVARYRKKVEKDDSYVETIKKLSETMEKYIRQNNALDIYEVYFDGCESALDIQTPSINTTIQFFDPTPMHRPVSCLSWFTDGPRKLAVSYVVHNSYDVPIVASVLDCFIWDVDSPHRPEVTLQPTSPVACLEYNPKEPHVLAGGQYNGQVVLWDCRASGVPFDSTDTLKSHKDVANCLSWIQSKTGNELFSSSRDGQVLWWDTRKLSDPTEMMYLDPTRKQDPLRSVGAECLEYEATMPTKFLAGCCDGSIQMCNRKAKSPVEKVTAVYNCSVKSPVYSLQRNPFYPKYFLSASGYQARFWSEDWKDSSIWSTRESMPLMASACWSPVRPSVFYTTNAEGSLNCWSVLTNHKQPIFSMKVSKTPVRCLKAHSEGKFLSLGCDDGTVSIVQVSDDLMHMDKNEKKEISEFFERETKREKNLELMKREKKRPKTQEGDSKKESLVSKWLKDEETEDEFFERMSNQYLGEVEEEVKKMSRRNADFMGDD